MVDLQRIEFVVTYRCIAHCKHCAITDDKRASEPVALDPRLAASIVRSVAREHAPQSVMTFGGEPLLFPDTVCAVHAAARAGGIEQRQVITNAGWPRRDAEFRDLAFRLVKSGINSMAISVDCFHQEHIPLHVVEQNVQALIEAGIGRLTWNPCWVISSEHDNKWNSKTNAILRALAHLPVVQSEGNVVQPAGNALVWLADCMPRRVPNPSGSCGDMPYTGRLDEVDSISVQPDGSIAVCNEFTIGNAGQRDILEILRDYDPRHSPEMKAILRGGIAELASLARSRGVDPDPDGYYSVCDMCVSLRREMSELNPAQSQA